MYIKYLDIIREVTNNVEFNIIRNKAEKFIAYDDSVNQYVLLTYKDKLYVSDRFRPRMLELSELPKDKVIFKIPLTLSYHNTPSKEFLVFIEGKLCRIDKPYTPQLSNLLEESKFYAHCSENNRDPSLCSRQPKYVDMYYCAQFCLSDMLMEELDSMDNWEIVDSSNALLLVGNFLYHKDLNTKEINLIHIDCDYSQKELSVGIEYDNDLEVQIYDPRQVFSGCWGREDDDISHIEIRLQKVSRPKVKTGLFCMVSTYTLKVLATYSYEEWDKMKMRG